MLKLLRDFHEQLFDHGKGGIKILLFLEPHDRLSAVERDMEGPQYTVRSRDLTWRSFLTIGAPGP